jgi:competence ComEA-like helix-hairpin-helix protein
MLQRNWFFWMEALQITAAERRVILGSMTVLLVITGIRLFYPGRTIYDESYYEPIIAEFERLSGVREEERRVLLARYYPPDEPDRQLAGMEPGTAVGRSGAGDAAARNTTVHSTIAGNANPGTALFTVNGQTQETALREEGEPSQTGARPRRPAASAGEGEQLRINIQVAGIDELVRLPGIGPVTAGRIVAYREENGPFEKPEDLLNVSGIGPVTLNNILEFIIVDAEPEVVPLPAPDEEA